MRVAQKLYEAGHIAYMRTDAPSLSKESIDDARNYINSSIGKIVYMKHKEFTQAQKMHKKHMRR